MKAFRSLRARLLLLVALAVLPAFGLVIVSTWQEKTSADARARQQTRQLASLVADEEKRLIGEARYLLSILANIPYVLVPELLPRCQEYLPRLRQQNRMFANIGMTDPNGMLLCSALPFSPPVDFSDRAWFRHAVAGRDFAIGDYLIGKLTGVPSVGIGLPVYGADGRLLRVLYATLDLAWLKNMAKALPLPPGSVVVVVDSGGTALFRHPDPENKWTGQPAPEGGEVKALLGSGCRGEAEFAGQDGVMRLNAIEPLQLTDGRCVYVRVGVPREAIFGEIERSFQRNIAMMLLVALLAFGAAWYGGDWLVLRRLQAVGEAARRFGEGDLTARSGLAPAADELGRLATSFDAMADGIEAREHRLAEADRSLRRVNRAMTVLSAGNRAMLRGKDEQTLIEEMCRVAVDPGGYVMAWVGYRGEGSAIQTMAHAGVDPGRIDSRCLTADIERSEDTAPGAALRTGAAAVYRAAPGKRVPSCMVASGCVAALSLPLLEGASAFGGVLTIYSTDADAFDEAEVELLKEAAADLAFGIGRLRDQARRREAEEANRIKSEFLANMSHELRTPLNAIIGFSDVLQDGLVGELSPQQREYVGDIHGSGRHLLSLINDILDLSKVEAGKMALDLQCAEVASLLENSLSVIREKAAAHRIAVSQVVEEGLPPIDVDPRKTKQIIYNLLSNAVKFTPDGGRVTLRVRRATRGAVEDWSADRPYAMRQPLPPGEWQDFLEIAVADTGIGIKPEDAPRLFKPFSQIDSSLSRRYEGSGLGLLLVMKMAQLHGGTVAVASTPGEGSCFTVWLPWRQPAAADALPPAAVAADAEPLLALVVEDEDAAAEVVRVQLEAEGLRVVRVASAEAALELTGSRHPAVIILDIMLPGMDGWDFLARCKAAGSPWAGVPVVIVSVAADHRRGFSLGAAHVLQKPVSREDMLGAVRDLGLCPSTGGGYRILVVDDDPKAVDILAAYLSEPGYTVLRAFGGREGIEMAGRERPDLLVLDLMMPEVSGFDVVEALHGKPETAATPIIVVTARTLTAEDRAQLNGHVMAIVQKASFNHGRFAAEVRRALVRRALR
jgi:signal transduction histidine kinase/CheY-like chemotaxis protein/HAMP domain-containing protein